MYPHKEHTCPPAWRVYEPENDPGMVEPYKIYARDPEEAAEKWADQHDSDYDYEILEAGADGPGMVLAVDTQDGKKWFKVTGEAVPQYSAEEMEGGPDERG